LKEKVLACITAVDAITPVIITWVENDGVMPEPEPEAPAEGEEPAAEEPAAEEPAAEEPAAEEPAAEEPAAEEPAAPQDIIKPITDLVTETYTLIDTT